MMHDEFFDGYTHDNFGPYHPFSFEENTMGSYRFQEAYTSDQSALCRLDAKCYDYPLESSEWQQILSSAPQNNPLPGNLHRYKCMTYRIDSKIVGYYVYDSLVEDHPHLKLLRLGVHPDYRQQGFGTMLLDNAIAKSRSMGLDQCDISIPEYWLDPEENRGIIDFVSTAGLIPVGHHRDAYYHYGKDYDAITYRTGGQRTEIISV